jgi:transmembrane sensor
VGALVNKQIIEEAADWFVELSAGETDRATKNAFDRWLRKSPEHARVYLEMLPIWEDGAIAPPGDETTAEELIALAQGQEKVVAMSSAERSQRPPGAPARRARAQRFAVAVSIALIMVLAGAGAWFAAQTGTTYATDLGLQRSLTLPDGSSVALNTQSRIRVRFTQEARNVDLLQGQALFTVAKDRQRPFTVSTGSTRVRAVGTAFDIYRKASGTVVTVVEGRVSVNAQSRELTGRPPGDALLSAGEQITLSSAAPSKLRRADVAIATAWTQGRLIFESTPLAEVAEEFNRYNARRIVVEARSLRDFHVNGSFRSSDPASLLRFLKAQPGLSVSETASEIHIARE